MCEPLKIVKWWDLTDQERYDRIFPEHEEKHMSSQMEAKNSLVGDIESRYKEEIDRLRGEVERLTDLVVFSRRFLRDEKLITEEEFLKLADKHSPEMDKRLDRWDEAINTLKTQALFDLTDAFVDAFKKVTSDL